MNKQKSWICSNNDNELKPLRNSWHCFQCCELPFQPEFDSFWKQSWPMRNVRNYIGRGPVDVILASSWPEGNKTYLEMIYAIVKKAAATKGGWLKEILGPWRPVWHRSQSANQMTSHGRWQVLLIPGPGAEQERSRRNCNSYILKHI